MPRVRLSLFLATLLFIPVCSASIAQTPNPSMPSDAMQPGIEENSPQFSEADRLFQQGVQQFQKGQFQEALQAFQQVLELRQQAGDQLGEADTLSAIAGVYEKQEQYQQALEQYQQALVIIRESEDHSREANALYSIGNVHLALQQYPQALEAYQQALAIVREVGYRLGEANALSSIGNTYSALQQYPQALEVYQQALVITRDINDRSGEAAILQSIGTTYLTLQQYLQALEQFQQALVIFRETGNRPLEAQTLYGIGTAYNALQQYSQAIEAYQQALPLFREVRSLFVEGDPSIVVVDTSIGQMHLSIGQVYLFLGEYSKSQEYLSQAVELLQKTLVDARASNSEIESSTLQNLLVSYTVLGQTYSAQEQYEQAIEHLKKALELAQQVGDQEFEQESYELLVINYALQGRAYEAQQHHEEALDSLEEALKLAQENGLQSWEALTLLYIGQIYVGRQDFTQALSYQQQAQAVIEQSNNRFLQTQLLLSRGTTYRQLARYTEALEVYQQAYRLLQEGNSIDAAYILIAIGAIHTDQNQYDQALDAYQKAQVALQDDPFEPFQNGINADNVEEFCALTQQGGASEEFLLPADSCTAAYALGGEALTQPFVLDGLNAELEGLDRTLLILQGGIFHAIGQVYLKQGKHSQALTSYEQALPILHEAGASLEGATRGDIGVIYLLQGQYDQALAFSQQAVEISRSFNHRINEEDALYYLAIVYWAQGNIPAALDTLRQKAEVENDNLMNNLVIGSEARKRTFLSGQSRSTDITVTFHLQTAPQNPEAARLALTTVLQRKGRILDAVSDNVQRLRQNLQPEDQTLFDDLNTARAELSKLYYDPQNSLPQEDYKTQVAALEAKIDELEDTLAQRSSAFRAEVQPVTIEAVQALIPTDAALVEFVRYSPFNPKADPINAEAWGDPHYAAVILTQQGIPQWIDLGLVSEIDPLIADFNAAVRTPNVRLAQVKTAAHDLDAAIMAPIRSHLSDRQHLLISPDGALNLIPFEALVDENDQYLVENFTLTYLTSSRDLVRLQAQAQTQQPPLLVADPTFGERSNLTSNDTPFNNLRQLTHSPLDGTSAEAEAIASHLPQAQLWQGAQATEMVVKQADRPSILHIATHGFFESSDTSELVPTDNPLLRSGLLLAGFRNSPSEGTDDGILTALEVSSLNLLGTELVVFSACDTGQGDLSVGEGVFGLRRALVLAGSESQVISLWRVQDDSTKELMVAYYERLLQGEGRSEALRNVQLSMLNQEETAHPYYWAPFIHSGDWTPLSSLSAP